MVFPLAPVYSLRLNVRRRSLAIGRKCMTKRKPRARHVVWRGRCGDANRTAWVGWQAGLPGQEAVIDALTMNDGARNVFKSVAR
jgi:hypothetical protein